MNDIATDPRLERGLDVLRRIELDLGNEHGLLHGMRVNAPRFKQRTIEMFGDHFAGEQAIELKVKLLLALAFAAAGDGGDDLLEFHVGAALKAGWRREQVMEVLELGGAYAGWPRAIHAVSVALRTFEKAAS